MLLTYAAETVDLINSSLFLKESEELIQIYSYTALAFICFLLWTYRNIRSSPIFPYVTMFIVTRASLWVSLEYLSGAEDMFWITQLLGEVISLYVLFYLHSVS